jgi:histidyl-tRNA synthetase
MANQRVEPRLLRGFRDYLPEDMIPRQRMLAKVTSVFERHGFSPLATPALEYAEVVLGKYGDDAEKLLFRFEDNGGRDVCMRYELTTSLARVAAQYQQLPKPIKFYQIGPVWRAERPGHGRFREFYQCDVDIIGSKSVLAEYECIQVDYDVLTALGIEGFTIRVNNRLLLDALSVYLGIDSVDRKHALGRTIDKLPNQGETVVRQLLETDVGLDAEQIESVFKYMGISGSNTEILDAVESFFGDIAEAQEGIERLRTLLGHAVSGGIPDGVVQLDMSIIRGLDYYTGTVYETFLNDLPELGSVMSGGRYDGLVSVFTGQDAPAVGISVGIDRLIAGLQKLERIASTPSVSDVLVTIFDDDTAPHSVRAASALRGAGICTESYADTGKLGKQMKYANKQNIPFALIIGPDEAADGRMTLKDMNSGDQHECADIDAAIRIVKESLSLKS